MTRAHVARVILSNNRATGVEFIQDGRLAKALADREVIVAGGAFNSPQLLMLSGIGPADHLRSVDIEPVIDLPVGQNLQDHLAVLIMFARTEGSEFRNNMRLDKMALNMMRAWMFGTGPATVVPGGLHAFIKTRPELAVPNIESCSAARRPLPRCGSRAGRSLMPMATASGPACCIPTAAARCCCARNDPRDKVKIVTNFFSAPNDLPTCARASRSPARSRPSRRSRASAAPRCRPVPR
jgi:choline dehydrogenase-like flavoprotein